MLGNDDIRDSVLVFINCDIAADQICSMTIDVVIIVLFSFSGIGTAPNFSIVLIVDFFSGKTTERRN